MSVKYSDEFVKKILVAWIESDKGFPVVAHEHGMPYNTLYGRAVKLLGHLHRLPSEAKALIRERGITDYFNENSAPPVKREPVKIPADLQAVRELVEPVIPKTSKFDECLTLLFDIETLPNEGYFFDTFSKMPIPTAFIKRAKSICTLAYKWLGQSQTHVLIMDEAYKDEGICQVFYPEYERAHYVVGHYADGFDVPFIDGRLQVNGLPPLPNKMILDTYKIAKKKFGRSLNSNRLDHLGDVLGLGRKNKTDAHLWVGCANNDPSAIEEMAAGDHGCGQDGDSGAC